MNSPLPVVCIGGAPSSGTTLLADLMDSIPGVVCPPELYIFSVPPAFAFDETFKEAACSRIRFPVPAPYAAPTAFFNDKYCGMIGMDAEALTETIRASQGLPEFVARFAARFAQFRDRPLQVFAEKTPINVNCAEAFCRTFPGGLFVHVVRDGRAVAASLVKRKYSLYEAALIWLYQCSAGQGAARLPGVVEVRYEDLLQAPFQIASDIARRVGVEVSPQVIESSLTTNSYRAQLPRIKSWSIPEFTGTVIRPASYRETLSPKKTAWLESLELVEITPKGKRRCVARFADLLAHYGYPSDAEARPIKLPSGLTDLLYREYLKKGRCLTQQTSLRLVQLPHPVRSAA